MNWRLIIAGIVLAAVAAAGWHYRSALAERDAADQRAAAAELVSAGEKVARATEQKTARTDNAAAAAYQEELENGKVELQSSILARLRAQQLRLRDQLAAGGNLPDASAGAGRRDASAPADFLAAHGDDALRLAAEADDAVRQLGACQLILNSDRAR
ncbi:hypothetical protein JOS77_28410 [Chromobacterium haemolyticum]|nr:hypothetical protein JOS77_28410 [Chromobacterium haemolyticum]